MQPYLELVLDKDRTVAHATPEDTSRFGALLGRRLDDLVSPRHRAGQQALSEAVARADETWRGLFAVLRHQGGDQLARVMLARSESGYRVLILMLEDSDEVRQLVAQAERATAVMRDSDEGIAFFDQDHRLLSHNPRFLEIMRFRSAHGVALSSETLIGRPVSGLLEDPCFRKLHECLARERPRERTYDETLAVGDRVLRVRTAPTMVAGSGYVGCSLIVRDLTVERQLASAQADAAREAGKAQVANAVLHNIGNVLNSVNVALDVTKKRAKKLDTEGLRRAARLLETPNLPGEKIGRLADYLGKLADRANADKASLVDEFGALESHIDHMKHVVAAQQSNQRSSVSHAEVGLRQLLCEAASLSGLDKDERLELRVEASGSELLRLDRHRVLEVLVNLLTNARDAVAESAPAVVTLRGEVDADGFARIEVVDNGVGIEADVLVRVFAHGYTTKPTGHGFGLHDAANAATEMGGGLTGHSEGPGKGARFTLRLPVTFPLEACA